ncbi:MAG: dihydropteroate synthase [Flavobacteriaceae bacterium]|nr:MAG: dihydropteroate synthase [Flavobacteriaceae bacterium]
MTINCKGKLIDLKSPKIMGILNLTPDSFYDGGKYKKKNQILNQVEKMLNEGATFIDLGAYSTRPGAVYVSEEEELGRMLPIIDLLLGKFPDILLSIDTFRSNVANVCIERGAALINDIAAGNLDDNMMQVIAKHKVPYIMMHMKGTPQTMQQETNYENLLKDILLYFSKKISDARDLGINDLIIDPGFGFAKDVEQNYELLQKLDLFKALELPILVGLSRKSMIYKVLGGTGNEALNGTTALNMYALSKGAAILRVHDVAEAMQCIKLAQELIPDTD